MGTHAITPNRKGHPSERIRFRGPPLRYVQQDMRIRDIMSADSSVCYLCKTERRLSDFTQRIDEKYFNMCKTCISDILTKGKTGGSLLHTESHRTCYLCRRMQPNEQFQMRSDRSYYSACKECNKYVFAQRRRARKMGAEGEFTRQEWVDKLAEYDSCPRCRRNWDDIETPPHRKTVIDADHIIPLAKGGSNYIDNIQPMCFSCNSKKGDSLE